MYYKFIDIVFYRKVGTTKSLLYLIFLVTSSIASIIRYLRGFSSIVESYSYFWSMPCDIDEIDGVVVIFLQICKLKY